jgi:hypothetical protein
MVEIYKVHTFGLIKKIKLFSFVFIIIRNKKR